jgi:hypothetical protein
MTELIPTSDAGPHCGRNALFESQPMIIGVTHQLQVGAVVSIEDHPFQIIRLPNVAEWRASNPLCESCPDEDAAQYHFYEVTTD